MLLTQLQLDGITTNRNGLCFESTPQDFYVDYVNDLHLTQEQDIYAANGSVKTFEEYLQTNAIEDYGTLVELSIEGREFITIISFAEWVNRKFE
jgi:hypothetical protein